MLNVHKRNHSNESELGVRTGCSKHLDLTGQHFLMATAAAVLCSPVVLWRGAHAGGLDFTVSL